MYMCVCVYWQAVVGVQRMFMVCVYMLRLVLLHKKLNAGHKNLKKKKRKKTQSNAIVEKM